MKLKLRQIGNSVGVIIPIKVITDYTIGEEIELEVITKKEKNEEKDANVITQGAKKVPVITDENPNRYDFCEKHKGVMKITCGCK